MKMTPTVRIILGDCQRTLCTLPDESVQCVVTSPPYWSLRDYGVEGQLGLEPTISEYLEKMVGVFREVRRVLRSDGTLWMNMGDSYIGSRCGPHSDHSTMRNPGARDAIATGKASWRRDRAAAGGVSHKASFGLKPKDMAGVPWRLAFAMQDDGWWFRRDIIWHKPNPMPESAKDRPTTAHEYVFLMTKSETYFYNTIEAREPVTGNSHPRGDGVNRKVAGWMDGPGSHKAVDHARSFNGIGFGHGSESKPRWNGPRPRQNESFSAAVSGLVDDRNYRSVWTIPTQPFAGAHFATFPEALAKRCIMAGSRPGDLVLDPFGGSGTAGAVALELGRSAILCELNPDYVRMIEHRTNVTPSLAI